jgi:5'-3' exonuclease
MKWIQRIGQVTCLSIFQELGGEIEELENQKSELENKLKKVFYSTSLVTINAKNLLNLCD